MAPEPTPTAGSAPPLVVRVLLGDPGALQRVVGLGAGLTPWQWFPSPDEAPLPDTEVTRALQALLDAEAAPTGDPARLEPLEDRFLDLAARAGGSLDATDDPWATLLALEAERRREQRAWTEVAELSGPLTEARDDREWPEHDLTALSRTAERLRKDHPGTPVADYAALYQLYALQEAGETPPDGISGLLDVVTSSEDPLLEQAVADLLPMALMGEEGTPSTEEREAIERTWDRIDDPASRAGVALAVLGGTIADGDAESTRRWTDRLVSASGELCGTPGPACSLLGPESRRAEGQIAALGGPAPTTWEAALVAGVWSCHLAGTSIPAGGESLTLGDGSGAGWSPISPLSACLAAMPSRPPPPEGRTIRLEVTR